MDKNIQGVWFLGSKDISNKKTEHNYGDLLGYLIPKQLFSQISVCKQLLDNKDNALVCIGSVLNGKNSNKNTVYIGVGTVSNEYSVHDSCKILCVRGPLTAQRNKNKPKWITDTGILTSLAFPIQLKPIHDVVVVLHKVDKHMLKLLSLNGIPVLTNWGNNFLGFIKFICSGKKVISSSLHGQVIAHSYGIEAIAVKCSDKVIGGDFKFKDYYASLHYGSTNDFVFPFCDTIEAFLNVTKNTWVPDKELISQKQNELLELFSSLFQN